MEFDENENLPDNEGDFVEIYSKNAIFWFAVFSPVFAAILLMINLWVAGFRAAVYRVGIFILIWAFATFFVENALQQLWHVDLTKQTITPGFVYLNLTSFGMNVLCGIILTRGFFKRYFPDDDYYPRSVQTPLFIFIGFILFFMLIIRRTL